MKGLNILPTLSLSHPLRLSVEAFEVDFARRGPEDGIIPPPRPPTASNAQNRWQKRLVKGIVVSLLSARMLIWLFLSAFEVNLTSISFKFGDLKLDISGIGVVFSTSNILSRDLAANLDVRCNQIALALLDSNLVTVSPWKLELTKLLRRHRGKWSICDRVFFNCTNLDVDFEQGLQEFADAILALNIPSDPELRSKRSAAAEAEAQEVWDSVLVQDKIVELLPHFVDATLESLSLCISGLNVNLDSSTLKFACQKDNDEFIEADAVVCLSNTSARVLGIPFYSTRSISMCISAGFNKISEHEGNMDVSSVSLFISLDRVILAVSPKAMDNGLEIMERFDELQFLSRMRSVPRDTSTQRRSAKKPSIIDKLSRIGTVSGEFSLTQSFLSVFSSDEMQLLSAGIEAASMKSFLSRTVEDNAGCIIEGKFYNFHCELSTERAFEAENICCRSVVSLKSKVLRDLSIDVEKPLYINIVDEFLDEMYFNRILDGYASRVRRTISTIKGSKNADEEPTPRMEKAANTQLDFLAKIKRISVKINGILLKESVSYRGENCGVFTVNIRPFQVVLKTESTMIYSLSFSFEALQVLAPHHDIDSEIQCLEMIGWNFFSSYKKMFGSSLKELKNEVKRVELALNVRSAQVHSSPQLVLSLMRTCFRYTELALFVKKGLNLPPQGGKGSETSQGGKLPDIQINSQFSLGSGEYELEMPEPNSRIHVKVENATFADGCLGASAARVVLGEHRIARLAEVSFCIKEARGVDSSYFSVLNEQLAGQKVEGSPIRSVIVGDASSVRIQLPQSKIHLGNWIGKFQWQLKALRMVIKDELKLFKQQIARPQTTPINAASPFEPENPPKPSEKSWISSLVLDHAVILGAKRFSVEIEDSSEFESRFRILRYILADEARRRQKRHEIFAQKLKNAVLESGLIASMDPIDRKLFEKRMWVQMRRLDSEIYVRRVKKLLESAYTQRSKDEDDNFNTLPWIVPIFKLSLENTNLALHLDETILGKTALQKKAAGLENSEFDYQFDVAIGTNFVFTAGSFRIGIREIHVPLVEMEGPLFVGTIVWRTVSFY